MPVRSSMRSRNGSDTSPRRQPGRRRSSRGLCRLSPPVWQLRVGEYRVFYDVDREEMAVYVRAVRLKPPHKTTEEIL